MIMGQVIDNCVKKKKKKQQCETVKVSQSMHTESDMNF